MSIPFVVTASTNTFTSNNTRDGVRYLFLFTSPPPFLPGPKATMFTTTTSSNGKHTAGSLDHRHLQNRRVSRKHPKVYVIESSSNLVTWVPLSTNQTSTGGLWNLTDSGINGLSLRFYRATTSP